jgi:polar amino acid transport system substrate-binding protein
VTFSSRTIAVLTAIASIGLASGCGGSSSGGGNDAGTVTPGSSADASLAAMVPAAVKSDGVIKVGMDTTYAPNDFLKADGKTAQGWDVDLFDAIAAKLGLKAEFVTAPFPTLLQAVQSGKYEIGVSSFTINPDREKHSLMVSYFNAGTQWATQKGNPSGITPDNACGKKVAVQQGTVEVDDLTARSKTCTKAGKPAIKIDQYAAQDAATTAVVSGKDNAMLADSPIDAYAVSKVGGQLELLGAIYGAAPYGFVLPKDATEFAKAIQGATQAIIDDGTYAAVLKKWGVDGGAITTSEINPTVG